MRRDEVTELHYITKMSNVPSMLARGLLSYRRAARIGHESVALEDVQELRHQKVVAVPGGRPLHEYVNLYLCARNPMMYLRKDLHLDLCVLKISTDVLDMSGTVVSDRNAAKGIARFAPAPDGLRLVDRELVFAEYWTHEDQATYLNHKAIKCAEILVPDRVAPEFILGAYVSCIVAKASLQGLCQQLPVAIDGHMFFRA